MPVQTNAKGLKTNVIRLDAKDDEIRRKEAKTMIDLARLVRESEFNVSRCVMAIHDPDVASFCPAATTRDYAMIEMFGSKNGSDVDFRRKMKLLEGFLIAHKYKVVTSKIFKKDYPVAKVIVKVQ